MLSVTSPWFLFGLLGITLPLIAHLIYSQQSNQIVFPSTRLITPTRVPQAYKQSVTDIILLIIRILLITAITLSMADLKWLSGEQLSRKSEQVILIDNSASMNTNHKFDRAMALVRTIIEDADGSVAISSFGNSPTTLAALSGDKSVLLKKLKELKPGLQEGDPQKAIRWGLELFSETISDKKMIIVSDFQASNWKNVNHDLRNHSVSTTLHSVTSESKKNYSLLSVSISELSSESLRVSARLKNHGEESETLQIQLQVGEDTYKQATTLSSNQSAQIFFEVPRRVTGRASIRILESDEYLHDNQWFFWLTKPAQTRVALISPVLETEYSEEEPRFLSAALLSRSEYQWQGFELVDSLSKDPSMLHPEHIELLVIAGFPRNVSATMGSQLRTYILDGGVALITTGNGMAETLLQLNELNLLSSQFLGAASKTRLDPNPFRLSPIEKDSRLYSVFHGNASRDLMLTRIYRFSKISLKEPVNVPVSIEDNYPLIIEKQIGKGKLIFMTLRIDQLWSDLPVRTSFVPLIKELLVPHIKIKTPPELIVGESLPNAPGFSTSEAGLFIENGERLSVNVSRNESLPENLAQNQVIDALGVSQNQNLEIPEVKTYSYENEYPLWQWLMVLAILLVILETLLAGPLRKRKQSLDAAP